MKYRFDKTNMKSVAEWERDLRDVCGEFRVDSSQHKTTTYGSVTLDQIHGVDVSKVCCDIPRLVRSREDIAKGINDHIYLILQNQGSCHIKQGEQDVMLETGDIAFVDSNIPVSMSFNDTSSVQTSFALNRSVFFSANQWAQYALGLKASDAKSETIVSFLKSMFMDVDSASSAFERKMILENIARLAFVQEKKEEATSANLYQRVRNEIAANFRDPTLTPARLSEPLGENLRTLQMVFQKEHETICDVINRYRLDAFQCELEQSIKRGSKPKISEMAYNAGFNDISYFNRRYKRATGMSPREYMNSLKAC